MVERIEPVANADVATIELTVRAKVAARGVKRGDSIAVNGCCLTATKISFGKGGRILHFQLLLETWERTNLKYAGRGSAVNLERALLVGGRLGGHFVSGHIDATGRILRWEKSGQDHVLEILAPKEVMRYVIFKGSITVDGISLTVSAVRRGGFQVWIIPHTFAVTALRERVAGEAVNLEADLLGKYVRQFVTFPGKK